MKDGSQLGRYLRKAHSRQNKNKCKCPEVGVNLVGLRYMEAVGG